MRITGTSTILMSKFRNAITALIVLLSYSPAIGQDPGFFLDEWQEKTATLPQSIWKEKTGDTATVIIQANMGEVFKKVPTYIYGNNAVTWGGNMNQHATIMTDINSLNPHVLRWPGGNLSQEYFWSRSTGDRPEDIPSNINAQYGMDVETWRMSTDQYYELLESTNSTGSICVNYSYARYGTGPNPVANAAHLAAEWVRYDKGRSKYWEIGNENFGNWEAGYKIDISQNQDGQPEYINGQLYGQHCKVFLDSMRAAAMEIGVDIKIGVVAFDAETSYDPINTSWNEGMMPEVGDLADFLIVHSYFTPHNQDSNIPTILNSHDVTSHIMRDIVNDMSEAGKPMIPVALTEWNIFAVRSMQQVSYINGMHAALVLGELVLNDYGMASRWDLTNGWNEGDDHGMFSRGGEPGVDHYNPRPVFFYMKYFQDYFGDRMVTSSVTGSDQVISYASSFSSGEAGMVLINKGSSAETVSVVLDGHDSGARYYTMTLTGGDDNGDFSRKVYLNGEGTDEEGGGPDVYETVKAFVSSTREGIVVDLPPLAVVYLMVEAPGPLSYVSSLIKDDPYRVLVELSEEVIPLGDATGFLVLLNETETIGITAIERDADLPYLLNITLDQPMHQGDVLTLSYSGGSVLTTEGVELPPFEKQLIANSLPSGPFEISFIMRISGSEKPVTDCEVTFNGASGFTDGSGEVTFSEEEGSYPLNAQQTHLVPVLGRLYNIESDTTFFVLMDSLSYQVDFQLFDTRTGRSISSVEVASGSLSETTSSDGSASLSLFAGLHQISFSAANYLDNHSAFNIKSDSSFSVTLEPSHAQAKFVLKDGIQGVNNALVVVGEDSLYTGQLGICTFKSIPIDSDFHYRVMKENYYDLSDVLQLRTDTTVTLQLTRSAATITFHVTTEAGPAKGAQVIMKQDTGIVNDLGICKIYKVQKDQLLGFQIKRDDFRSYSDSLKVMSDTTVSVKVLALKNEAFEEDQTELVIYPNPAEDRIFIESRTEIQWVEVVDVRGESVLVKQAGNSQRRVELLMDLPQGFYLVKVGTEQAVSTKRVVISR